MGPQGRFQGVVGSCVKSIHMHSIFLFKCLALALPHIIPDHVEDKRSKSLVTFPTNCKHVNERFGT
jgi:hypothetical protein